EAAPADDGTLVVGDSGPLKEWFGRHRLSFVILRPDRFVAAAGDSLQRLDATTRRLGAALHAQVPRALRSEGRNAPSEQEVDVNAVERIGILELRPMPAMLHHHEGGAGD